MEKTKENALEIYVDMMKKSWSYERLTENEKSRLLDAIRRTRLFGTFRQRWETLQAVNFGFLLGVGYKPIGWRENENGKPIPLF